MTTFKINVYVYLYIISCIVNITVGDDCPKSSDELRSKVDYCWSTEVEIVDRVVQTSKSVLNFAKKKLGIAVEDENEEKKCDYYLCILRQLRMLNANEYPAYENIKQWTEKNVVYNQALEVFKQLNRCNEALTNSTIAEKYFSADSLDKNQADSAESKTGEQTTCQIATEFIKCLSMQPVCPIFQFP